MNPRPWSRESDVLTTRPTSHPPYNRYNAQTHNYEHLIMCPQWLDVTSSDAGLDFHGRKSIHTEVQVAHPEHVTKHEHDACTQCCGCMFLAVLCAEIVSLLVWAATICIYSITWFHAILNFDKTVILGPSDSCMANIYLQTKFDTRQSRNCWDRRVYVFRRWQPSAILDLFYLILDRPRCYPWWAVFSLQTT